MKAFLLQLIGLFLIAALGAVITYQTLGGARAEVCVPAELKPGYVCLKTVVDEWKDQSITWVDARPRKDWEKERMPDAVLLNADPAEDYEGLLAEQLEQLAFADKLVVYCGRSGCKASDDIATRLRDQGIHSDVYVLFGGVKQLKELLVAAN